MKRQTMGLATFVGLAWLASAPLVNAAAINCDTDAPNGKNYMAIPDSQVLSCVDAGLGTLSGNTNGQNPDEFLTSGAGSGYTTISKTGDANPFNITYNQGAGTWSFDASAWNLYPTGTKLVLGFKWGTGNTPDEYFLYQLVNGVNSGTFQWFNIAMTNGNGTGGLSHMILYGSRCVVGTAGCTPPPPPDRMPEPGTLALLWLGLLGVGAASRRSSSW